MKKIIILIFAISIVISLAACSMLYPPRKNKLVNVDFYDYINEVIDNKKIPLYFDEQEEVPFIEITTLLDLLPAYLSIESYVYESDTEGFSISYIEPNLEKNFKVDYELDTKMLELNHIEFLYFLDGDLIYPDYYYLTEDYNLESHQFSDAVLLDLGGYNLTPIIYQEEYYLPLVLANLLFSGFQTNLYFNGVALFAINADIEFVDFPLRYISQTMPQDLQKHIIDFLGFYYDYFYGLNFSPEPYKYRNLFAPLKETLSENNNSFYQTIDFLVKDFDDMHMHLVFEGYYGGSYSFDDDDYQYKGRTQLNIEQEEVFEVYCENNLSRQLNSTITLLIVNEFDTYTAEVFAYEKDLYIGNQTTDVVIDFTCNPGGYMYAMMDMLPYVIDGIIPTTLKHHTLSGMHSYYFESNINRLNQDIYIKTSALTYSAANIFTLYAKTYGDVIIIGEKSSGGSSHVDVLFAPGGMLLYVPFAFHFSNHLGDNVEYGIPVDYTLVSQESSDLIDLIEYIRLSN
jgi:carboxyl-terminal processing protease